MTNERGRVAVVCVGAVVLASGLMHGCCKELTECPSPPLTQIKETDKKLIELSAKLAKLDVDATAKFEFETIAEETFASLNDCNLSLVLLLRSSDCVLRRAKPETMDVAKEIARANALTARELAMKCNGAMSVGESDPTRLSSAEVRTIEGSYFGAEILDRFEQFGIERPE